MKPEQLVAPACPYCSHPAVLVPRTFRVRRGDRVLPVDTLSWQCSTGCPDPFEGTSPYQFADAELMAWSDEEVSRAWESHFGEPLPPSRRGQRQGEPRNVRIPVLLTASEVSRLDAARGGMTRSDYLRRLLVSDESTGSADR